MNYHNIVHDDMRNGTGLRVTLFVSGCDNKCKGCQNPQTWDANSGIHFDEDAREEIFEALSKPYISGLTISGGDPLYHGNLQDVWKLCFDVKMNFPNKTIWVYTGSTFEDLIRWISDGAIDSPNYKEKRLTSLILQWIDVLVDGKFVEGLADVKYHWAGSTNQRVINMNELRTLLKKDGNLTLYGCVNQG